MLKSLFGDLTPLLPSSERDVARSAASGDGDFAATTILDRVDTEIDSRGRMVDRHSSELVVSGSPAQAIRHHFAQSRADLETASRQIALFDPASAWAGAVIKALSDAAGGPIERLHLREQETLLTIATIERTTIARRNEDTLKIYNAEVRGGSLENVEIPLTLMEGSHLAVVIVGPMQPPEVEAMLGLLVEAARQPTWHCPNLLFLLPPGALALGERIRGLPWPAALRLQVQDESLTSASAVWNAMLGAWNQVKALPGWDATGEQVDSVPFPAFSLGTPTAAEAAAPAAPVTVPGELQSPDSLPPLTLPRPRRLLDAARASRVLDEAGQVEGLLGCAVVHVASGLALARRTVERDQPFDIELASAAATQMLRAERLAADSLGLVAPLDDIVASAGSQAVRAAHRGASSGAVRVRPVRPAAHQPRPRPPSSGGDGKGARLTAALPSATAAAALAPGELVPPIAARHDPPFVDLNFATPPP